VKPADVVVVGGSAAGAAAAILCCQQGLKTVLVEARTSVRDIPGETLHPGIEPLFRALGIDKQVNEAGFARHAGHIIRSKGSASTSYYRSGQDTAAYGYQADRARLHSILLSRATECGAHMLIGETALYPIFDRGKVSGIISSAGHHPCRFVVDASGHAHWMMRQLRVPILEVSPRLVAFFGWGAPKQEPDSSVGLPEFEMHAASWKWCAPILSDRHAWVHLDLERNSPKQQSRKESGRAQCPQHLSPLATGGARDVTWRIARPSAGPGYFIAGDAAWVLDPASSHGVLFAFLSAMATADAINGILRRPKLARAIESGYVSWVENWFCRDAASLISLYETMERPPTWLSQAIAAVRYIAMSPSERASSSKH
jgi:flavin-dependent dehydrogenase